MSLIPRPGIMEVRPYVGGESSVSGAKRVIRLASNENPLGAGPRARAAYGAHQHALHRYPDGGSTKLRETIAQVYGLDAARIVNGSGSDELITLLVRAYAGPGDEVLHSAHGFLMYSIATKTVGATAVAAPERNLTADVDALLSRVSSKTRLLFLANPNNPTGSYLPAEEIARLREALPDQVLLVIDAAYAEYVARDDYEPGAGLVEACDNVVMIRTFSKIYGLASLRLGWAYCPPGIVDVLHRLRGPFNVTGAAQEAGVAALLDPQHVERSIAHNAQWLAWLGGELAKLGLDPAPSVGNFLLVEFPEAAGRDADAALKALRSRGILVRAMGAYGLAQCLRITVGTEAEMKSLRDALREFLA